METRFRNALSVLGLVVFAYFVAFPRDLTALLTPVKEVLSLSTAVSPWLYGLIAVAILAWTLTSVWGRRSEPVPR
jgi:hypothetical protein